MSYNQAMFLKAWNKLSLGLLLKIRRKLFEIYVTF